MIKSKKYQTRGMQGGPGSTLADKVIFFIINSLQCSKILISINMLGNLIYDIAYSNFSCFKIDK